MAYEMAGAMQKKVINSDFRENGIEKILLNEVDKWARLNIVSSSIEFERWCLLGEEYI